MNQQRLIRISHYQNHLYCILYFSWVCDQTLSLLILFLAINTNLFCRTPPPPKHIQQKTYFCNKRFICASPYIYVKNHAGEILYSLTTLRNYRIISIVREHKYKYTWWFLLYIVWELQWYVFTFHIKILLRTMGVQVS